MPTLVELKLSFQMEMFLVIISLIQGMEMDFPSLNIQMHLDQKVRYPEC
jgi:hypothetical protein